MLNRNQLYRKLYAVKEGRFIYHYYKLLDWWKTDNIMELRLVNMDTNEEKVILLEQLKEYERI